MTPEALAIAETAAEAIGCPTEELLARAKLANWKRSTFEAALSAGNGWRDRFAEAVAAGADARAAEMLRPLLARGPLALLDLQPSALLRLVDPALHGVCLRYDPAEHGGRVLCGPTELGKTTAAAYVCRRLARARILARVATPRDRWDGFDTDAPWLAWVRAFDLPNARLQQPLGEGEAPLVREAMTAELLVLDDLGWESTRAKAEGVVAEVLAARYDRGLVTLATSGLTQPALVERYGEALLRRVAEAGGKPGKVLDLHAERNLGATTARERASEG